MIGVIRRTYTYFDESTFLCLYKALLRPLLEYANQVWAPHSVEDIEIIDKLPTLAHSRLRGDMIETFKILQGKYDPQLRPLLEAQDKPDIHNTRGHNLKLFQ